MGKENLRQYFERASDSAASFYGHTKVVSMDSVDIILKQVYSERTCETCSENVMFNCEILNALQFGHDEFGCIKWEER